MPNRLAFLVLIFGAALWFPINTSGQASPERAVRMPAPSASASFAAHDLSGVWNALRSPYDFASFSKGDPPMTAWGLAQFHAAKPSQGPRGVLLSQTNDKVYKCVPPGMPYIYLQLFPMQIVQTPAEVIELFEYDHTVRHIFVDGRKHSDDVTPTHNGESIGHWEGGTLVVDTIGLNGKLWLDRLGHPDSDRMHIVERIPSGPADSADRFHLR